VVEHRTLNHCCYCCVLTCVALIPLNVCTSRPSVQWSDDEKIAARLSTSELHFYSGNRFTEILRRLKVCGAQSRASAILPHRISRCSDTLVRVRVRVR
jgi:uncharacterized protein with WD repeat